MTATTTTMVMTMTVMATAMLAATATVLDIARPPHNTSKLEGGTGGTTGNETLPPSSGPTGTRQCPPMPKKPLAQDEDKPAHLTIEEWAAFNIAEEFESSTTFKRYIC